MGRGICHSAREETVVLVAWLRTGADFLLPVEANAGVTRVTLSTIVEISPEMAGAIRGSGGAIPDLAHQGGRTGIVAQGGHRQLPRIVQGLFMMAVVGKTGPRQGIGLPRPGPRGTAVWLREPALDCRLLLSRRGPGVRRLRRAADIGLGRAADGSPYWWLTGRLCALF